MCMYTNTVTHGTRGQKSTHPDGQSCSKHICSTSKFGTFLCYALGTTYADSKQKSDPTQAVECLKLSIEVTLLNTIENIRHSTACAGCDFWLQIGIFSAKGIT